MTTDQTVDQEQRDDASVDSPTTAEAVTEVRTAADAVPTESPTGSRRAASVQAVDASFADFDVRPEIVAALAAAGISQPFPIQAMTLPVALAGHDIIGQAKTGTGKTLGFGVPLLHRVVAPGEDGYDRLPAPGEPQALVVVPTRELAVQVAGDLAMASTGRKVRIVQVYGGRAYEPQVEALQRGADVVVGTPGRMIDLLNQRHLRLKHATEVVLDEADEMLDLGFLPDVEKLLAATPPNRHTMLFSATMPGAVVAMARRYMSQPTHIRASAPDDEGQTVKNIKQVAYRAHALDKVELLARILQANGRGLTIVFARTKRTAAKVADELVDRGFAAGALHGDLGQGAREQALRAFRHGKVDVLVATDVAARGIDVEDVTHVINYQCPEDEKTYLHRTGRTGRAGNKGTAVTFVDWDDLPRWGLIDKSLDLGIPTPVETYSSSEHVYTDLDIPKGVTGRLPKSQQTRAGLGAEVLEDLGETGKRGGGARPARSDDGRPGRREGGRDGERGGGRDGQRDGGRSGSRPAERTGEPAERTGEGDAEGGSRRRRGGRGRTGAEGAPTGERTAEPTSERPAADAAPSRPAADGATGPDAGESGGPRRRRRRRSRGGSAGASSDAGSPAPTDA
ncbi:DEAD/DEAH box helicase [Cellulomonas sp. zg-ZUI222]|uniref:RNA helicase n=1 Tax=Cellulomonas wangleii TaxID=2816956 RepID=A0ABX8D4A5_9CELL|nr:DEAD/DEAH box helicase [Cellulomonas wangleii]MBO0922904.1 DEAD/DEAH box helicase [Cellulomonas wangleii]QVI61301.1 DEAD/DEAH box helicase [Cellulomonas wangleii]